MLVSLAFSQADNDDTRTRMEKIAPIIARNEIARRKFFLQGFCQDSNGETRNVREWRWLLCVEDVDWLIEQAYMLGGESPWLWQEVLRLACSDSRRFHSPYINQRSYRNGVPDPGGNGQRTASRYAFNSSGGSKPVGSGTSRNQ